MSCYTYMYGFDINLKFDMKKHKYMNMILILKIANDIC